jgi:hypothetical protein
VTRRQRFWSKVKKGPGCWEFQGSRRKGYGRFYVDERRGVINASRYALEEKLGRPLRPGMEACHTCDNPACVRPSHLFEGTHQQNCEDRSRKGRSGNVKGEKNGRAELSVRDVKRIRALPETVTHASAAPLYGVTPEMISLIRRGLAWTHV